MYFKAPWPFKIKFYMSVSVACDWLVGLVWGFYALKIGSIGLETLCSLLRLVCIRFSGSALEDVLKQIRGLPIGNNRM